MSNSLRSTRQGSKIPCLNCGFLFEVPCSSTTEAEDSFTYHCRDVLLGGFPTTTRDDKPDAGYSIPVTDAQGEIISPGITNYFLPVTDAEGRILSREPNQPCDHHTGNSGEPPGSKRSTPDRAKALHSQGVKVAKRGDLDTGIRFVEEAIRLDPQTLSFFHTRAVFYEERGNLAPWRALNEYEAGRRRAKRGQYGRALERYRESMSHDATFAWPLNNAAWILATCPDETVRNANEAVKYATKACKISNWICCSHLGTLAAAFAQAGRYKEAVEACEQARALAPSEQEVELKLQLACYKAGKAYRDEREPSSNRDEQMRALKPKVAVPSKYSDAKHNITSDTEDLLPGHHQELERLIGLPAVKNEIRRLTHFLTVQQERRRHGLRLSNQTLHFVFRGNPGTGKTTVARIVGSILHEYGVMKTNKFVECGRSDLVGGYLGQTALKTDERINEALDGVLFIDEAYTLLEREDGMYGKEVIGTLLKRMEDHRDRLVVIIAGYTRLMNQFMEANPGLKSRFTRYIDFEDYSVEELCLIFEKLCTDNEYTTSTSCKRAINLLFSLTHAERDETFGNARHVRNIFEDVLNLHSNRLVSTYGRTIPKSALTRLEALDIPLVLELIKIGRRRGAVPIELAQSLCEEEGQVHVMIEALRSAGVEVLNAENGSPAASRESFRPSLIPDA